MPKNDLRSTLQAELQEEFAKQLQSTSLAPAAKDRLKAIVESNTITPDKILQATDPGKKGEDNGREA